MFSLSNTWFFVLLLTSLTLASASSSLFFLWVSLEINMLAVLPILMSEEGSSQSEVIFKYFMVQSVASILFLFFFSLEMYLPLSFLSQSILVLPILLKMGVAPFHNWLLSVVNLSPLFPIMIISTVQKFIPLIIFEMVSVNLELILMVLVANFFLLFFLSSTCSNLRGVLFISSTGNMMWILMLASNSSNWNNFFLLYCFSFIIFIFIMLKTKVNSKNGLNKMDMFGKILITSSFFSIAGLPPFPNFFIKLWAFFDLSSSFSFLYIFMLIITSLLVLLSYMSLSITGMSNMSKNSNNQLSIPLFYSTMILMFVPFFMIM